MTSSQVPFRRRHPRRLALTAAALAIATTVTTAAQLPALADDGASSTSASQRPDADSLISLGDPTSPGLGDLDDRGVRLPSLVQERAVAALGVGDVRWNRFGTPTSLLPTDGSLGAAAGSPVDAARSWLEAHASVFGLTRAQMAALDLVNNQQLAGSPARAVLFRQHTGDLSPALDSMVTVGVAGGKITYVSSSLVPVSAAATSAVPTRTVSALDAFLAAAHDVGRDVSATDRARIALTSPSASAARAALADAGSGAWTKLRVPDFDQPQLVRPRTLLLADGRVRPVLEVDVVDNTGGEAFAYTVIVDGQDSSKIWNRENKVFNENNDFPLQGTYTSAACGPVADFEVGDGKTKQIVAFAAASVPTDDIVLKLTGPGGQVLASGDTATSPETVRYAADSIPQGVYGLQVCPFDGATAPVVGGPWLGNVVTTDQAADTSAKAANPKWRYFPSNPSLDFRPPSKVSTGDVIGCWKKAAVCEQKGRRFINPADKAPWDDPSTHGLSSFTTIGNNANTHEAWFSPLTPGGLFQAPYSPTREYTTPFTDAWNNSGCDPAELTPGGNDIDFSVGNLFVSHNRMHDFAYYNGFTEKNYNMQLDNYAEGGVGGDPEVGNAQAGAVTGGSTGQYLGRDNANQIALQDGVPGITNQYLFQPIAGAFYAPCTDGGLDFGIVGHEYTHAISNRMVGGPDEGLSSDQGGAMGESWSDLTAAEYLFGHGLRNGGNPWAVGVYATGNKTVAIRDYAINRNPLNYSDLGFDTTGPEVHADGEIWNGTQWSVRQALVAKYDKRFPYDDRSAQFNCAMGTNNRTPDAPRLCPGNRRWMQLVFDSYLLQQPATSMLDARDAMLAADPMRFPSGPDRKVMWHAFASRGMGAGASTPNADSSAVTPSFASPMERNGTVTLRGTQPGKLFVGVAEARATPVADTLAGTRTGRSLKMVPGTYRLLFVSKKGGFERSTVRVTAGRTSTVSVGGQRNLSAAANGAKVIGATDGSLNPDSLIDGTEATNWGGVTSDNVDRSHPMVAVDLAGGRHTVRRVQVSAMLTPAPPSDSPVLLATDPDSGSRFTALRQFALEACTTACGSADAVWKRFYTSPGNAFPAKRPRPVFPDLTLRSFAVPATPAAAVRLVTLENQCTGYAGYAGEQDNDPLNDTDCATASDRGTIVHAAELQVFGR